MTHESAGHRPTPLTRRAVLAGAVGTSLAGAAWLAGCSNDTAVESGTTTTGGALQLTEPSGSGLVLAPVFDASGGADAGYVITGTEQRLCFTLQTMQGDPVLDGPESLIFTLATREGAPVGAPIEVKRRNEGVPIGYYPLRTTFDTPGIYRAATKVDGTELTQAMQVYLPSSSSIPKPGGTLPPSETPTVADARGVDPICTRKPEPCPFHTMTLTEALASGGRVALLVSTPEFCQIGVCGPVLDLVIKAAPDFPDVTIIHAEVYKDAQARRDFREAEAADIITEYGLTYEPALFLADATGTITARLDNVFDNSELREELAALK